MQILTYCDEYKVLHFVEGNLILFIDALGELLHKIALSFRKFDYLKTGLLRNCLPFLTRLAPNFLAIKCN